MNRIKLLIFHPYLAPYRVDTFNALSTFFSLKVVFQFENLPEQKFNQKELITQLRCDYDYLLTGINIGTRQIRYGVSKKIKEFQPDVIVCHEYGSTSLICSLLRKISHAKWGLVAWTSDNVVMCNATKFYRRIPRKLVLSSVDSMLVYSQEVKEWYASYLLNRNQIFVCPNIQSETTSSVNNGLEKNKALEYADAYKLLGMKIVLFIGRLSVEKGIDRLITAFSLVNKSTDPSALVIVGDGPEKQKLVDLTKNLKIEQHVIFTGRFEGLSLKAWYRVGNIFVLSSHHELYGAVVNEALISGLRVVCSKVAGANGLIVNGLNGHIFDPLDIHALAELIAVELMNAQPLSAHAIVTDRKSLMPINFDDAISDFVKAVEWAHDAR